MDRNDPVIIAGGGLGGLTTALALARRGWPVRVLEGAPKFGAIGFGIQFGPNVFQALDRIGVSAAVLEKADTPPAVRVWPISDLGVRVESACGGRADLRQEPRDRARHARLQWGRERLQPYR
jgi:2-polyprenyl-6-methoxyphenol hydroxylase-like FAD-dependent oxidoreductase